MSTDPHFVEKLRDVVGLYVDPPERAVVFAFDERRLRARSKPSTAPSQVFPSRRGALEP